MNQKVAGAISPAVLPRRIVTVCDSESYILVYRQLKTL
ncbi:hypothetical protein SAMN05444412_12311 [Rhodonellum ikkaensis]|uniref:Uncharacterized protein n=1 Tax=Rhodonellum ikkaensis TaxID=336829 RepID=A0A1H3TY93_9BACT|nr:hypothetical protein SAMN05444412_12311 [Rhodonellum ikkaensis]